MTGGTRGSAIRMSHRRMTAPAIGPGNMQPVVRLGGDCGVRRRGTVTGIATLGPRRLNREMAVQAVKIGRGPPRGRMVHRLCFGMATLAKIGPAVAGETLAPIHPHPNSMSPKTPELGMIRRLFLLMATGALRLAVANEANGVVFQSAPLNLFSMVPFPGRIMSGGRGLAGSAVIMAGRTVGIGFHLDMGKGRFFLAPLRSSQKGNQNQ